jgi:hypothetical protein
MVNRDDWNSAKGRLTVDKRASVVSKEEYCANPYPCDKDGLGSPVNVGQSALQQ